MTSIKGSAAEDLKEYIQKTFSINGRGWGFADNIGKNIKVIEVSLDELDDGDKEKTRRVATTVCELVVDRGTSSSHPIVG